MDMVGEAIFNNIKKKSFAEGKKLHNNKLILFVKDFAAKHKLGPV